jgi:alpha-D-ribose 1-methylphosphonate 5-triphosphate synthase subunit PhnH
MTDMTGSLAPAFVDPVLSSQATFRAIMEATARPGTVVVLSEEISPPPPLSRGAAAVVLSLLDQDTPVWLDAVLAAETDVTYWLRFHTGAPITNNAKQAAFVLLSDSATLPPLETFALGTLEYPDRSATVILQVKSFARGTALMLSGPGIKGHAHFRAAPLPGDLAQWLTRNRALFPLGVDLLLVTDTAIAVLPRSVTAIGDV